MKKPVALIDLDGTLADFHGSMARDMAKLLDPAELATFAIEEYDGIPHLKARADLIKHQPGWWYGLQRIEQGFLVMGMLKELDYKLHICTRASIDNPRCWMEKVQWVNDHVRRTYNTKMTITQDKALMNGAILMDDWPNYVEPWLKAHPAGIVIMPDRPWNRDFKHIRCFRHLANDDGSNNLIYQALKGLRTINGPNGLELKSGE